MMNTSYNNCFFKKSSPKKFNLDLASRGGFTLMEILVVVVIIGFLATFVAPKFFDQPDKARMVVTKQQIRSIAEALELYKLDNRNYPTTEQGLKALVEKPTSAPVPSAWKKGGYMQSLPKDPWGAAYIYLQPGIHGDFDIMSYAADGKKGGEDEAKDITSWE